VQGQEKYTSEARAAQAVAKVIGALPLIIPALADHFDSAEVLRPADGLMIPGGMSNVHPSCYDRLATPEYGPFDRARDATTLSLIRAALERGVPILMTCRGFQELNVALGGTLKPEPDVPEEKKHGTPESARSEDERFRIRHVLDVVPGGALAGNPRHGPHSGQFAAQPTH
jgi:putative glutamine amidotransferase